MRCPAPTPASYSVWPTWVSIPRSAATSLPESSEIIGMPASTPALIESPRASASGIEIAIPSGCEATAASISCDLATHVLGGLVDTVLDDRPVGVRGLTMGNHDEAEITAISATLAEGLGSEA